MIPKKQAIHFPFSGYDTFPIIIILPEPMRESLPMGYTAVIMTQTPVSIQYCLPTLGRKIIYILFILPPSKIT